MKRLLAVISLVLVLTTACSSGASPTAQQTVELTASPSPIATVAPTKAPTPTPTKAPTPTPTPTPTPVPTPTIPPSLTTGLPSTSPYKPICIMIENKTEARPQAGLSQADIVYECFMEGSMMTRFMAVFNDTLPKNVGPVRSCRLYFVRIAEEYHSALAHYGGPDTGNANIYPMISTLLKAKKILWQFDGWGGVYGEDSKYGIYWRISQRPAPHNVYSDLTKISALMTGDVTPVSHFQFSADAAQSGANVNTIEIKYTNTDVDTVYKYNAAKNKYDRSIEGKPMMDANNNEQVAVTNIIIQYAKVVSLHTDLAHIDYNQIGTGTADVFLGGKHIKATWSKKTEDDITKFYDESGSEIQLLPGNTWVELVPTDKSVPIKLS